MKRTNIIFLFGLFPLIASSSSLAYAVVVVASLWVFFASYILGAFLSSILNVKNARIFVFFFTFLLFGIYVRATEILFPIVILALFPYLYLLCFSYIVYFCIEEYEKTKFPTMLLQYSLLFFLIAFMRELLAFGSISLPSMGGIASFNIFAPLGLSPPFRFLGSTAGALMLSAFILAFYFWYNNDEVLYVRK